jgi:hypothetical protein
MKPALFFTTSLALVTFAACSTNVQIGGTTGTGGSKGTTTSTNTGTTTSSTGGNTATVGTSTGTGAGVPSDVTGTVVNRYYSEAPPVDYPVPLNQLQVEALTWNGSTWTTYPGNGHTDGSFDIPNVPAGEFMLDLAGTYVYTTAHKLDLGSEISGRPTAMQASPGTLIGGTILNLSPWQSTDQIEWYDANGDGAAYAFSSTYPTVGDSSLMGQPSMWSGSLIEGAKGDILYITQISGQTAPAGQFYTVVRFLSLMGVQQQDGSTTNVMGSFAPVTADQTVTIDFRASEFAKQATAVNPNATGYGAAFDVATLPGAGAAGLIGYETDLCLVEPPGSNDVNLGTVKYANPFPPAWGTSVYAGESFNVLYKAPGASSAAKHYGSVFVQMPPAQASAGPIHLGVSPVLNAQINGTSAFGMLAGVGTTPVLSWSAPATGTPTAYQVLVYQVVNSGGTSVMQYVTTIATTTTKLPFPPNVLQKGNAYVFTINAIVSPIDASTAPFRYSPSLASASLLTSMVVP